MTSCGLPSLLTLTLGRRTDFVSSTVLRWCNASHIRAHSTTVVTPASPLRAWDASNSKGKKSPIYFCKVELNYGTYFLKKSAETLHVLFWFCCKPFTTSIGWLMHECKCYFFCNSEIAHGHSWLHHQQLHCLSDNFTSIHYGKKGGELSAAGLRLAAADTSTCWTVFRQWWCYSQGPVCDWLCACVYLACKQQALTAVCKNEWRNSLSLWLLIDSL